MPFYYVSASDGTNVVKVSIHYTMKLTCHDLISTSFARWLFQHLGYNIQLFHACLVNSQNYARGAMDSSMHYCPRL